MRLLSQTWDTFWFALWAAFVSWWKDVSFNGVELFYLWCGWTVLSALFEMTVYGVKNWRRL